MPILARFTRPVLVPTAVAFLVAGLAGVAVNQWYRGVREAEQRDAVRQSVQPYADAVSGALGRRVAQIMTLKAFVETVGGTGPLERGFAPFGAGLIGSLAGVRAVEVVRNGRIAMVYPTAGNERALTVEFRRHPSEALRRGYARAIASDEPTIVGPLPLVQGGVGLLFLLRARPAYDPSIELVETVVELPSLLGVMNLAHPPEGIGLQLVDRDGGVVTSSHAGAGAMAEPVILPISGFDDLWELRGAPIKGWDAALAPSLRPIQTAIVLVVLLITLVAFQVAERDQRLHRMVEERTASLQQLAADQQQTIVRMQEAELALASSEERLRLALTASRSATFEIDVASGRMTWSEGVGPIVGRPEGTSPDTISEAIEYVEPTYRSRVAAAFAAATSGTAQGGLEARAPRMDGGVTWLALTWVSRPDGDGVVRRVVGTMTDISERKRLEEQFLHAQKMQAMGTLAGGVAHDFNNLLTVIIGAGQMARRAADAPGMPEELRTDLNEVLNAGQRAAALTGQLLAFSRRQVVQPRHFDLCVLIGSLEAMLRRLVGEGIQIETAFPGAPIPVFADQGQLTQVVMNLVINARDAMPSGGTLRIAVRTDGRPGGVPMPEEALRSDRYAVLSVSDGGVGIAPEILPQIFHPFFTTKPVGQGTGLGLATVYGIVMQLGGTVRVQSRVGHGATFDIYIPIDEHAPAEQEVAATTAALPDGEGRTVLLAEDEPGLRKLSERVLSEAGYRVLVAADGAAALGVSRAHAGPIDLLITDVVMPGLGGVDLAAALRKERPTIRVLLVSGYPRSTTSPADAALAQVPFLAKPFLPGELRAAATQALADD